MKILRYFLISVDVAAVAVLLAIPIGKVLGVIHEEIDAAAVFGWLIFFVPLCSSAFALWGIVRSHPMFTRIFVVIAVPGCFLMAFVSILTTWSAPTVFMQIGLGAAVILGLNVLALWDAFVARVKSLPSQSHVSGT